MKLSEAVKCYEECFGDDNSEGAGGCLYDNCPLHEAIEITAGRPSDEGGQITWKIEGCSLLGSLEEQLKDKVPGVPFPED
ncbi:unnamed protein product [marine sediment metagenome]|uniref:Uncharacterized protein n=1 Tax=marine sediment metagenome TaxID=412755 RepID=X0YUW9_9ZZZZ